MQVTHDNGKRDKRYGVYMEYTGDTQRMFMARFCGEWIGCHKTVEGAWALAQDHADDRHRRIMGAA